MPGPLAGIKVVDVSTILSGPIAAMLLAEQGAEVVKVERPGIGDLTRIVPFRRGGLSSLFANANRGKRSIVLALDKPRGREILLELVRRADVFVENYRPGTAERLRIAEPDLRRVNRDLIYVSISGFGDSGPYRDRRAYDPIIQGLSGHVAVQSNPEVPIRDLVRNLVADKSSAYTAAQAITAALFARERGAGGQWIRIPMLDASLSFFWPDGMMAHTFTGPGVEQPGPALYEVYRLTETVDGHLIYFAASDVEFHALFRALDRAEWCEDPRFASFAARVDVENRQALGGLLAQEFRKWPTAEILKRLVAGEVPVGPVLSLEELPDDAQIRHNECIVERTHPSAGPLRHARPAARFDKTPQQPGRLPPLLGEHTEEILAELGYDAAACQALRGAGVIP